MLFCKANGRLYLHQHKSVGIMKIGLMDDFLMITKRFEPPRQPTTPINAKYDNKLCRNVKNSVGAMKRVKWKPVGWHSSNMRFVSIRWLKSVWKWNTVKTTATTTTTTTIAIIIMSQRLVNVKLCWCTKLLHIRIIVHSLQLKVDHSSMRLIF